MWLQSGCTPQGFHCKVGCFALSRSAILARVEAASYTPIAHFPPELLKDKIITKVHGALPLPVPIAPLCVTCAVPQRKLWRSVGLRILKLRAK